jgi:hypothetical protein
MVAGDNRRPSGRLRIPSTFGRNHNRSARRTVDLKIQYVM